MRTVEGWFCELHPLKAEDAARRILDYLFARKQFDDEDVRELANALRAWATERLKEPNPFAGLPDRLRPKTMTRF